MYDKYHHTDETLWETLVRCVKQPCVQAYIVLGVLVLSGVTIMVINHIK